MKGPYERLKHDLRRLWECPACKRHERTDGTVTSRLCPCGTKHGGGQPVVMKLIHDGTYSRSSILTMGRCAERPQAIPAAEQAAPVAAEVPSVPGAEILADPPPATSADAH